jgi:hypothetical protein
MPQPILSRRGPFVENNKQFPQIAPFVSNAGPGYAAPGAASVKRPGIQDTGIYGEPMFPGGVPQYPFVTPTLPPLGTDGKYPTVTPASIANQHLGNLPNGQTPESFVNEQRSNYERSRKLLGGPFLMGDLINTINPNSKAARNTPERGLIDFDSRNRPVPVRPEGNPFNPAGYLQGAFQPRTKASPVFDPLSGSVLNMDISNPNFHDQTKQAGYDAEERRSFLERFALEDAGMVPKNLPVHSNIGAYVGQGSRPITKPLGEPNNIQTLEHELTHSYTNSGGNLNYLRENSRANRPERDASYWTDNGPEYTVGATNGLNAFRQVTGRKLNTPQEIHQLFDEIEKRPNILNSIGGEHQAIFRSYLNLRENNPPVARQLREAMARDGQFLVQNGRGIGSNIG